MITSDVTRGRAGLTAALAAGALLAAVLAPAPAQAHNPAGIVVNGRMGGCLDSNQAGDVRVLPCETGSDQSWFLSRRLRRLVNVETLRCLDSNRRGKVFTTRCSASRSQIWTLRYTFQTSKHGARINWLDPWTGNLCLTTGRRGSVYMQACRSGSMAQSWYVSAKWRYI
jgi:hypothetical protein